MGRFRNRRRGVKVAHPARKYPRRKGLYETRMMCNISGKEIAEKANIAVTDYFRLERVKENEDARRTPMRMDADHAHNPFRWTPAALRVCDTLFADPEMIFADEACARETHMRELEQANADVILQNTMGDYSVKCARPEGWHAKNKLRELLQEVLVSLSPSSRDTLVMRTSLPWYRGEKMLAALIGVSEQAIQMRLNKIRYEVLSRGFARKLCVFCEDPWRALMYVRGRAHRYRRPGKGADKE